MRSEHITLSGITDGTNATGVIAVVSDVIYGNVETIRIPKGLALKIWSKHINGADVTVKTQYTLDVSAESPTWVDFAVDVFDASVEGDRNIEKRRPLLFRGFTGKEAVRFTYTQEIAGISGIEINAEFCEMQ
jgi:hypothetical protein